MSTDNKTSLLKTQERELIKEYTVLDGAGRVSEIYTTWTGAPDGTPCTKVEYEYDTTYANRVIKMKESKSTWDSAWDITP